MYKEGGDMGDYDNELKTTTWDLGTTSNQWKGMQCLWDYKQVVQEKVQVI